MTEMTNFAWFNGQKIAIEDGETILKAARRA